MPTISKPSGEKGTSWLSLPVEQARFKLTAIYVLLLAIVFMLSSVSIRYVFEKRVERRFFPPSIERLVDMHFTQKDLLKDLLDVLLVVNLVTLGVSVALAYWLAGLTLRPIERAAERERRFVSHASHELRTPLTILQTELENAQADASEPEQKRIKSYLEEVDRLRRITDDLLDQSKGGALAQAEHVNLSSLLHHEIERVKDLAAAHRVTVTLNEPATPVVCETVPLRLSVAVQNVLQNAIRYNKPDGSVTVDLASADDRAIITITDTGIGIPAKDLEHVFDRFYRVQREQAPGTGLGLALVKETMNALGGDVAMTSEAGSGTRVVLTV